jgi:predicted transcriptional regulator
MERAITIRIPEAMRRDLEAISRSRNVPLSDLVRESIRRYVAVSQFRELRARMVPHAEAQGIVTDEDVFEALS